MVNPLLSSASDLVSVLRRYTQTPVRVPVGDAWVVRVPSLRWIAETAGGISHQRLSEFRRDPSSVGQKTLDRIRAALESPSLQSIYEGDRITYFDAPGMTAGVLSQIEIPPNASAFRFVVPTADEGYNGFRSTEWSNDFSRLEDLANYAPGGASAVTRIVFDTAEQ